MLGREIETERERILKYIPEKERVSELKKVCIYLNEKLNYKELLSIGPPRHRSTDRFRTPFVKEKTRFPPYE